MRLEGKTALITGAGRGIGMAIAHKFLVEGARIAIVDVVDQRVRDAADSLRSLGSVVPIVGDLSTAGGCDHIAQRAIVELENIDILVNNAGIVRVKSFLDQTEDDWDVTFAVNAKAQFLLSQHVARHMIAGRRKGVIINAASTNGLVAERSSTTYDASKGAAVLLTQAMALDLAPYGIRVVGVAPGLAGPTDLARDGGVAEVDIDALNARVPVGRIASVDEVANVYAFLASDEASHILGTTVVVDGGLLSRQFGDS